MTTDMQPTTKPNKDHAMTHSPHPRKTLVETQLGLFFAVGPAGDENAKSNTRRQSESFGALEALLKERGMSELGKPDPSVSDDFRFLPFELCECEFDEREEGGQAVYSVWFYSGSPIEQEAAVKLRDMALEAYRTACGADAQFVRADLYEKWEHATTKPFAFAD